MAGRTGGNVEQVRSASSFSRMKGSIGGIVRSSCVGELVERAVFSTFTYSSHDADLQRAKQDAPHLAGRLKRKFPTLEYLLVLEPHEKGDWHIHAVLILPENVEVPCAITDIGDVWPYGKVHSEAVTDANGLADYFNPFSAKKKPRQRFYPPGDRTFFASAGMRRPEKVKGLSLTEARERVKALGYQYDSTQTFGSPGEDMGKRDCYRIP
ncbi:rolling circle replication-associated protein [Gordonibacter urolithinfaciens]|uniref:rolling circle replication-associated protein n=1 Tax=Gordonibacter urolithinfaciens TaxID=1335613 RepID=UPI003AAD9277